MIANAKKPQSRASSKCGKNGYQEPSPQLKRLRERYPSTGVSLRTLPYIDQSKNGSGVSRKPKQEDRETRKTVRSWHEANIKLDPDKRHTRSYLPENRILDHFEDDIDYRRISAEEISAAVEEQLGYINGTPIEALNRLEESTRDKRRKGPWIRRELREIMRDQYFTRKDALMARLDKIVNARANDSYLNEFLRKEYECNEADILRVKNRLKGYIDEYEHGKHIKDEGLKFKLVVEAFTHIDYLVGRILGPLMHIFSLSPDREKRDAAQKGLVQVLNNYNKLFLKDGYYDLLLRFADTPEGRDLYEFDYNKDISRVKANLENGYISQEIADEELSDIYAKTERKFLLEALITHLGTNGSTLDDTRKDELKKLMNKVDAHEYQFSKNVENSKFELIFKPNGEDLCIEDMEGFPDSLKFLAKRKADDLRKLLAKRYKADDRSSNPARFIARNRKISFDKACELCARNDIPNGSMVINLDDGLYFPFISFAKSSELRKRLYIAKHQRGTKLASGGIVEPRNRGKLDNKEIVRDILKTRMQIAQMSPQNHSDFEEHKEDMFLWQVIDLAVEQEWPGTIPRGIHSFYEIAQWDEGFKNYLEYSIAETGLMDDLKDTKELINTLDKVVKKSASAAYKELLKFQKGIWGEFKNSENNPNKIYPWDIQYLLELYCQSKLGLNDNDVREYFDLNNTVDGMFKLTKHLFGIDIKPVDKNSAIAKQTIHKDAMAYEVSENGRKIGTLYLDLFSRDGKSGSAWDLGIVDRTVIGNYEDEVLPQNVLVNNFEHPGRTRSGDLKPLQLSHMEVTYLLHEYGHALHSLLSEANYEMMAGYNTSFELGEFPSLLFENFAYHPDSLKFLARHHETGDEMPADLIKKLRMKRDLLKVFDYRGNYNYETYMSSVNYDWDMHEFTKAGQIKDVDTMYDKYTAQQQVDWVGRGNQRISMPSSLGHIFDSGYQTNHSTYAICEMLSQDFFDRIMVRDGVANPEVGQKLRREMLSKGGTVYPRDIIKNLLDGRDFSLAPFAKTFANVSVENKNGKPTINTEKNKRLQKQLMQIIKPKKKHKKPVKKREALAV